MYRLIIVFLFSFGVFAQDNQIQLAEKFQLQLNEQFADSLQSPLLKEDLAVFKSLNFYTINKAFIVEGRFKKAKNEKAFEMKTSTARTPMYKKFGTLFFEIEGKKMQLNVYQNLELLGKPGFKDYLFLPFSDLTNGNETYIGGRYIDFRIPKTKKVILNFNLAYNPYCAYNYKYSCPIVPLENDLNVEIKAGVKKFHD